MDLPLPIWIIIIYCVEIVVLVILVAIIIGMICRYNTTCCKKWRKRNNRINANDSQIKSSALTSNPVVSDNGTVNIPSKNETREPLDERTLHQNELTQNSTHSTQREWQMTQNSAMNQAGEKKRIVVILSSDSLAIPSSEEEIKDLNESETMNAVRPMEHQTESELKPLKSLHYEQESTHSKKSPGACESIEETKHHQSQQARNVSNTMIQTQQSERPEKHKTNESTQRQVVNSNNQTANQNELQPFNAKTQTANTVIVTTNQEKLPIDLRKQHNSKPLEQKVKTDETKVSSEPKPNVKQDSQLQKRKESKTEQHEENSGALPKIQTKTQEETKLMEKFKIKGAKEKELKEKKKQLTQIYCDYFSMEIKDFERMADGSKFQTDSVKSTYQYMIKKLLESMLTYKRNLFQLQQKEIQKVAEDPKQQYRIYGLLLSGSIKGINNQDARPGKNEASLLKDKIIEKYPSKETHHTSIFDENVNKSLSMTWSMLTLLPPLLVVTSIDKYNEQLHDTNRHTWEEDNGGQVWYYRPILVYGNQLHVAVKGLVGNNLPNKDNSIAPSAQDTVDNTVQVNKDENTFETQ